MAMKWKKKKRNKPTKQHWLVRLLKMTEQKNKIFVEHSRKYNRHIKQAKGYTQFLFLG